MNSYQLYYFGSCPFCIKTRIALWGMGVKLPTKNIKRNKLYLEELVKGGGKKQVPCLRIEDKHQNVSWLYESSDIIDYFNRRDDK